MNDRNLHDGADEFAERVARPLRSPERLDDTFDARVMSAVYAEARERERTGLTSSVPRSFWRRQWAVRVSPLSGLAMAAGIAGLVVLGALGGRASATRTSVSVAAAPARADTVHVVRFVFLDSGARAVSLVGDFNDWRKDATPLLEMGENGLWTASVEVPSGRHEYAFVVRGANGERWVADPLATPVHDDFGTESSVITVSGSQVPAPPSRS